MDEMAVERIPEGEKNKRFKYTRIRLNSWRPELPRFVSFHMANAHIIQYFKESEWTDKSLVSSHGKRVRSRQDDIDTEVRHMQRKAHLRMLKYGSTPQKCDECPPDAPSLPQRLDACKWRQEGSSLSIEKTPSGSSGVL